MKPIYKCTNCGGENFNLGNIREKDFDVTCKDCGKIDVYEIKSKVKKMKPHRIFTVRKE